MARTKKQVMDKEASKTMQQQQQNPPRELKNDTCHATSPPVKATAGSLHHSEELSDTQTPWSMTSEQKLPLSLVSHVNLPKAFVRVEDICRTPDENVLKMMKRQMKKEDKGGHSNPDSGQDDSSSGQNDVSPSKSLAHDGEGGDSGAGDRTVSSSSTSSSKNIFEQFDTEIIERRSPRRRSASPRGSLSSSLSHQDRAPSRSGSEEKQQLSIASAVKALRSISEKVGEGRGRNQARGESASGKHSRESSPRTPPPRKQSPRRSGEKISPPDAGLKAPKAKKMNSASPSSDCNDISPTSRKRVRSPRRLSPDMTVGPSLSQQKSCTSQDSSPSCEPESKTSPSSLGDKQEHTIHILSSTSSHIRVQVDARLPVTSKASRQLFSGTDSVDTDSGVETKEKCETDSKTHANELKPDSGFCHGLQPSESKCSVKHDASKTDDADSSLLCAMLVGGSEVTKNYEQSREQNTHTNTVQHCPEGSPPSTSRPSLSDRFFDDDSLLDMPEPKPFELPLLSRLPPLIQLNAAVLELTKTEKSPTKEQVSLDKPLPGHNGKTTSLLKLISKVKGYLQLEDGSEEKNCTEQHDDLSLSESGSQVSIEMSPAKRNGYTVMSSTSIGSDTDTVRTKSANSLDACHQGDGAGSDAGVTSESAPSKDVDAGIGESDLSVSCTSFASEARDLRISGESCPEKGLALDSDPSVKEIPQNTAVEKPLQSDASDSKNTECQDNASKASCDFSANRPGSPDSLGELDTAQITKAATQAVQRRPTEQSSKSEISESGSNQKQTDSNGTETPSCPVQTSAEQSSSSEDARLQKQTLEAPTRSTSEHSIVISSSGVRAFAGSTASSSKCQPRSARRVSAPSPTKKRWQPKIQQSTIRGPHLWSRAHEVVSPSPLEILSRPVKNSPGQKSSAFSSRDLERYLHNPVNKVTIPASKDSKLAQALYDQGKFKSYEEVQQILKKASAFEREGSDCEEMLAKSDEEEEDHDDEREIEISKKVDPDFDVVDGLVFASFDTEMAMQAHMTVEKVLKWDKEPMAFVNIAKFRAFEESRRAEGNIRRESQGLRGVHMRWRKYQRLYRRELKTLHEENEVPWVFGKVLEKTSDITKIKNWKKKFGEVKTEEGQGQESQGEDSHSQQKIKRKRKTYVFSTKKKVKRLGTVADRVSEPASLETSFEDKFEDSEDVENFDTSQEVGEEGDYGHPIPIDEDDYMDEVQHSLMEMNMKQHGLRNTRGIFSRLNMGPEDRHIFKKLGGWVTRLRMFRRLPNNRAAGAPAKPSPTSPEKEGKKRKSRKPTFWLPLITSSVAQKAVSALQLDPKVGRRETRANSGSSDAAKLSDGEDFVDVAPEENSPDPKAKEPCDKPGCRYGCICHLCLPNGESDEQDQSSASAPQKRSCDKEYCRLGCICDSLEKSSQHSSPSHCGKPECVLQCQCKTPNQGEDVQPLSKEQEMPKGRPVYKLTPGKSESGDTADSSGDELPMLEKTTARRQRSTDRYSNLPRRQTSYRVAKNLDAVSRKAMMIYETSEIYCNQTSNRRKKIMIDPNTTSPPRASAVSSPSSHSPSMPAKTTTAGYSATATTTVLSSTPVASTLESTAAQTSPITLSLTLVANAPSHMKKEEVPVKHQDSDRAADMTSSSSCPQEADYDSSAVLISDDDSSESALKAPSQRFESKRSRLKRKMFSSEKDTSGSAQPVSANSHMTSTSPPMPPHAVPVSSQQPPPPADKVASSPPYSTSRWHTSMVCLKANPVMRSKDKSDDVQEEDEIKLLEFITNCNWDVAKRDILYRVAGCLTRGHYPNPRVMFVSDFRVEILPKAARPSVIPPELRNRLPEMMFSIRVRVTQYKNTHTAVPVNLVKNTAAAGLTSSAAASNEPPVPGVTPASSVKAAQPGGAPAAPSTDGKSAGSMGISGLGRLQISQNRPVSVSEMQAAQVESFRFQAQKIDNTDKAGAPADDQPVKKKRKKKRKLEGRDSDSAASKRELGAEDSSKLNSHPEDAGGAKKAASLPSAARLNIPQIIPANKIVASPGAGKAQLLGVSAGNLGDIKFIQLPGQGGILQLVPANVFGIKASPDGKNGPNYVAVPLLGPIGLAGAKKTGVSAQTHTPTGTSTPIGESLAGKDGTAPSDPDQLQVKKKKRRKKKKLSQDKEPSPSANEETATATNATALSLASALQGLRVTPAQNISRDAPSASTVSELKDIAETESSVVSRKSDNSSLTFAVPATASLMSANPSQCVASHASNVMDSFSGPVSLASGISNLSSVSSSAAGGSIVSQKPDGQRLPYAVPAFYDPNDEPAERASRGAHRFPGYTSAAHGIIPNTFVVASRVGVSGAGKGVEGSKPASPVTTSESGHAKTAPSLPKGNPTERSTCKKSDTAGERPGVGKSPIGSASLDIAGPSVPASSISGLSGFESSGQFDAYPVRLVKNQMAGEDNTRGSGSSFSDDDIDILLSEVDEDGEDGSIDSDKEKQQCAPCPQCYNSTASGKTLRMCEVCKNSSGTKLKRSEHSLRERHYRAQCARMIKYLREILFAADPALKSTSNHIAKAKLVSKAALVVKYQQKLSVSLKRGLSVEKQRHSMLQRQLNSKLESLRKEGVSAEAISSILSSITLPSLPQASASSQVHAGEKELLHAECAPGSGATDLPASSSAKSTHSFTTSPSPWQVGSYTNSGKPGGGEMPVVAKSTSSASQDRNTSRRRKSEKPVKHWTVNKSSDFVIEIERAEEDENFVDEEESADLTQKQPNMKPSEHENFQDKQRFGDDDTEQRLESEHQKLEKTSVVKDVPPLGCNAKTPSRVSEEKEECDSPVYPALSDCTYEKQQANKSSVHHGASCAVNNEQAVSSGTTNLDKDLASSELEKHAPCEDQDMENEEANLESECVIPVITSVTSLQNTDINFEDGDIVTPLLQNVDTEA